MKTNSLYIGFFILACLCGCRASQKANHEGKDFRVLGIDLENPGLISGECVFKDFTFTKLETTDKSLFNDAEKVIHFDNKLFIQTPMGRDMHVLVFKDSGEFLFRIEQGREPDEVIFPSAIAIDKANKWLLVLERYKVLKAFDFTGKRVETKSFGENHLYMETLGDRFVFFDGVPTPKPEPGFYVAVRNGEEVVNQFMPKITNISFVLPYPFFKISEDSVLVSCYFSDTVYCVSDGGKNVRPHYVLDYNGRSVNQRLGDIPDITTHRKICNSQNNGTGPTNLARLNDRLFFQITAKDTYFVVYDLKKNIPTLHTRLFDGLPNKYAITGFDGEGVIFSYSIPWLASYFEEHPSSASDSEMIKQLRTACANEEDNPVLVFCKF